MARRSEAERTRRTSPRLSRASILRVIAPGSWASTEHTDEAVPRRDRLPLGGGARLDRDLRPHGGREEQERDEVAPVGAPAVGEKNDARLVFRAQSDELRRGRAVQAEPVHDREFPFFHGL